jgi:hypothetical protein
LRAVIFFAWGIASVSHFLEPLANSHEQKNESVAIWLYSSKKLLKAHVFYFQRTIFFSGYHVPHIIWKCSLVDCSLWILLLLTKYFCLCFFIDVTSPVVCSAKAKG